jgi:putative peptidoglycan lipid II flippase
MVADTIGFEAVNFCHSSKTLIMGSVVRSPVTLSILNFFGRVANFVLYLVVANLYGASQQTDWFFFVYAVAYFFIGICYYATESSLVAVWHRLPVDEHREVFRMAVGLSFWSMPLVTISLFISGLLVAPLQGIMPPDSKVVVITVCLLLAWQPSLAFLTSFFSSYRQYSRRYCLPTIHLSLRTVGVLGAILLFPGTVSGLAFAYLAGELVRLICLQDCQFWRGWNWSDCLKLSSKDYFWSIYGHVVWMTIALLCTVVNPVVDLAMVGRFSGGTVTLVEYAGRLRGMPVLALGGLLVYFLGEWSHQHYRKNNSLDWSHVNRVFWWLVLFSLPAVGFLMVTEKFWVPLIFFSEKFSVNDLWQLRQLLYWYFPGVIFLAGSMVLSRALLVIEKARRMALVTLVAVALNIVCNLIFIDFMGVKGVAFSTSIVDVFVCLCFYLMVRSSLLISSSQVTSL